MSVRALLAIVPLALSVSPLLAQTRWGMAAAATPIQGACTAIADPNAHRVLVYNMSSNTTWSVDTWFSTWQQIAPQTSPMNWLYNVQLAYDRNRDVAILFGGSYSAQAPIDSMFEFDGTAWQAVTPAVRPPARRNAALCYDPVRDVTLLVGGDAAAWSSASQPLHDAWTWDGSQWTQLPGGFVGGVAMAVWDDRREVVVVVAEGGTYEWSGGALQPVATTASPPPPLSAGIAYDSARERVVLYGGYEARPTGPLPTRDDVWEYDGSHWIRRQPLGIDPGSRGHVGMVYDGLVGAVRVFAGVMTTVNGPGTTNSIWSAELHYEPVAPASVRRVGSACGAATTLQVDGAPWLGDTVTLTATSAGGINLAVFALGFAPLPWGTATLDAFGLPYCSVLVQPELLVPVVSPLTQVPLQIAIPVQTNLLGASLYAQALDIGTTSSVSHAMRLRIGGR